MDLYFLFLRTSTPTWQEKLISTETHQMGVQNLWDIIFWGQEHASKRGEQKGPKVNWPTFSRWRCCLRWGFGALKSYFWIPLFHWLWNCLKHGFRTEMSCDNFSHGHFSHFPISLDDFPIPSTRFPRLVWDFPLPDQMFASPGAFLHRSLHHRREPYGVSPEKQQGFCHL